MRRRTTILVLAALVVGGWLLSAAALGDERFATQPLCPRHHIQVVNATRDWVRIRIESDHAGLFSASPGVLPPGGTYADSMYAGPAAYRRVYAYSASGQLVAFKRVNIDSAGLLRVPAGTDGGWIFVDTH